MPLKLETPIPDKRETGEMMADLRAGKPVQSVRLYRGIIYQGLLAQGVSPMDALTTTLSPKVQYVAERIKFTPTWS